MGVWGTGIFANDTAADLKDQFEDVVRLPITTDELIRIVTGEEDGDDFHLALADLFHTYGIDAPAVREKAIELISSGDDLKNKRELGMTEPDLRRRA
jgi:hypothetical protein